MESKALKVGNLVYLTIHYDKWLRERNANFNIPMVNRIAKIIKIFDWDSDEGQLLLAVRDKSGKWGDLDSKDFKYVIKIFYPDLIYGDKNGYAAEELVPKYYPKTDNPMFGKIPINVLNVIVKAQKEAFKITKKTNVS